MTCFELSFQFPIKRVGASPLVAAGAADSDASGAADSIASGSALSDTAGAGAAASSPSLFELEIRIAPSARIPRSTTKRTFDDDPCFFGAELDGALVVGLAVDEAPREAAGVVETFTREEPVDGTGGILICEELFFFAAVFLAGDFLTAFLTAFFAVFFAGDFFAGDFFAVFFTAFLAGDFLAVFLAADFFGAAFLAADFFFTATFISLS